jgi:GntR family transcriptional regulator
MVTLRLPSATGRDRGLGGLPLHERVAVSVRRAVAAGELAPGEALPTARDLADAFGVHPNTVLRAYRALRDEGVIELRAGRGAHVRRDLVDPLAVGGAARRVLGDQVDALLVEASRYGVGPQELSTLIEERDRVLAQPLPSRRSDPRRGDA